MRPKGLGNHWVMGVATGQILWFAIDQWQTQDFTFFGGEGVIN